MLSGDTCVGGGQSILHSLTCRLEPNVAVDWEEDVELHVEGHCESHGADPVPKGFARGKEALFCVTWRSMGHALVGPALWLRRIGAKTVGRTHALLVFFSWVCVELTVVACSALLRALPNAPYVNALAPFLSNQAALSSTELACLPGLALCRREYVLPLYLDLA